MVTALLSPFSGSVRHARGSTVPWVMVEAQPSVGTNEFSVPVYGSVKPSQMYFWDQQWQQGERRADTDIAAGAFRVFAETAEVVTYLESLARKKKRAKRRE